MIMELERQENVLVIGHQVHEFFVLSGKSLSDLCFPGYFALFVSAARLRQNLRSMRCLLAKYAHASSFHLCLCFFWWGGCHADTHISTICHKRICLISKSRCIQS